MKKIKRVLFLVLVLALTFTFITPGSNTKAAEIKSNPLESPESYIDYLNQFKKQTQTQTRTFSTNTTDTDDENVDEIIDQFSQLSSEKQELFLDILSNTELMALVYAGESDELGEYAEYIQWTESDEPPLISTFASTKTKTISHTGTLGVLGVPITKYKITGKYNYTSSGATSALSTKGEVVYHYNPTIATDLTYYGGYINNKKYYGEVTFYYKVGVGSLGIVQIGNVYLKVSGNHLGKLSGSIKTSVKK
ncbi:hypothetical protein [Peribacillus frigoritolerans]|uniref:Uncharacterized protein n=1 Tax=Peribacillus castrilensis TaxID=2897690 RepID=A0AAW9N2I2_9BACI|nr:hypothetical protein [Peribacillus castrilensis]